MLRQKVKVPDPELKAPDPILVHLSIACIMQDSMILSQFRLYNCKDFIINFWGNVQKTFALKILDSRYRLLKVYFHTLF